jgi:prephenate dehydrogenase
LKLAKDKNAIDCYSTDISAAKCADIIFICSPVDLIVNIYKEIVNFANKKTIVCDIGSIKFNVENKIKQLQQKNKNNPVFIGCHPMCGIEQNGIEYASLDIYNNANVVITSNPKDKNTKIISKLWKEIGCKVLFMSAKEHDETVAFTSHIPHIIAFSFYKMFREKKDKNKNIENLVAGSFKSLTRVAKSSPQMWIPIFLNNKNNLKILSKELCKQIKEFTDTFGSEEKLKKILDKSVRNETK